ncbi:hypothetical protein A2U01_0110199, partial [Trifolium medium]|nr:hypothetical protein [Trifolium medium]
TSSATNIGVVYQGASGSNGGVGDLGGHGSDPPRRGRGRGKRLPPRDLKRRVVYNRNLTSMPRRLNPD